MRVYNHALIIDDDHDLCMLLKAMLESYIPDVKYVHSLQKCQEILLNAKPDIVFIDNNLPDGKGALYIKNIKTALPDVRIVMISALTALKVQALEYGADVFIEKPLTQANVHNALQAQ